MSSVFFADYRFFSSLLPFVLSAAVNTETVEDVPTCLRNQCHLESYFMNKHFFQRKFKFFEFFTRPAAEQYCDYNYKYLLVIDMLSSFAHIWRSQQQQSKKQIFFFWKTSCEKNIRKEKKRLRRRPWKRFKCMGLQATTKQKKRNFLLLSPIQSHRGFSPPWLSSLFSVKESQWSDKMAILRIKFHRNWHSGKLLSRLDTRQYLHELLCKY